MATEILTAQRLRELLNYSAATGVFTRLVKTVNSVNVGDIAGCNHNGYTVIRVLGRAHKAHRLAWLHFYGEWPAAHIDHIDGDKANNAISNLRDVSHSVNQQNQRQAPVNSSHGFMGASRIGKRWKACIYIGGKSRHLGLFDTPEEASAAYMRAKRLLHPGCTI